MMEFVKKHIELFISIPLIIAWQVGGLIFGNDLKFNVIFFSSAIVCALVAGLVWGEYSFRRQTVTLAKQFHDAVNDVKKGNEIIDDLYDQEKKTIIKWQETSMYWIPESADSIIGATLGGRNFWRRIYQVGTRCA